MNALTLVPGVVNDLYSEERLRTYKNCLAIKMVSQDEHRVPISANKHSKRAGPHEGLRRSHLKPASVQALQDSTDT